MSRNEFRRPPRRIRYRAAVLAAMIALGTGASAQARDVVLLHGLNRTSGSMSDLAAALEADGRQVHNVDYPSGSHTVAALAHWLAAYLRGCCAAAAAGDGLDFVTHSLGGILVRELRRLHPDIAIHRVVMLAPPNQGSELVDTLGESALFRIVTGPAGQELGTGADSVPNRQGRVDFALGVIAGHSSINPLYSWIIPGADDGTVAVARARVEGMQDFIVIDANHTFVMHSDEAIRQVRAFLRDGRFDHR